MLRVSREQTASRAPARAAIPETAAKSVSSISPRNIVELIDLAQQIPPPKRLMFTVELQLNLRLINENRIYFDLIDFTSEEVHH